MLGRIKEIIKPGKIDYILSSHTEMDHSGSIPKMLELSPDAKVIASPQGEKGLRAHYGKNWNFLVVKSGDALDTGERTLRFIQTPMLHWPDSMMIHSKEDKILFSCDGFGQHIAGAERYDDEIGRRAILAEAKKYYGNILMPFGNPAKKALDALSGADIELVCPAHGLIWRSFIKDILGEYAKWANYESEKKAVIVYDSMWNSTAKMAGALKEGIEKTGTPVKMRNLKTNHISDIAADITDTRLVLIGSPTLNNGVLPSVGALLTYLKGLKPAKRTGFAFGSFGWAGGACGEIEKVMKELNWELPLDSVAVKYVPAGDDLEKIKNCGQTLADGIRHS